MIYVVATLTVKPETRAEFIAAAAACIAATRKEPGNIAYDLHESVTDHSKMVFVEQWESAEALVPHRAAEHMITADAERLIGELRVGVPVADVPGEPQEIERRASADLDQRLCLPGDLDNGSIIEHQPVEIAKNVVPDPAQNFEIAGRKHRG